MSLCLAVMDSYSIFIGADSATSIKINNVIYRKDEKAQKLFIDNDNCKVIFCAGYNPLRDAIMEEYSNLENKTAEILKEIALRAYNNSLNKMSYIVQNSKLVNNEDKLDAYQIGIMLAGFENGKPMIYGINSANDFQIEKLGLIGEDGVSVYTFGIKEDECHNKAVELLNNGENLQNTYIKSFQYVTYEAVGGFLQVIRISEDNGIQEMMNVKLKEKADLKRIQK